MVTLLGICFSTVENQMPQCDNGSTAETMVIHFDEEKFEQLLSRGSISPPHARKHKKISVGRVPLATLRRKSLLRLLWFSVNLP